MTELYPGTLSSVMGLKKTLANLCAEISFHKIMMDLNKNDFTIAY